MGRRWVQIGQTSLIGIACSTITTGCIGYRKDTAEVFIPECITSYVGDFVDEDKPHIELARKGCIRNYGEGACLVKLTKTARLSYQALCRRMQ